MTAVVRKSVCFRTLIVKILQLNNADLFQQKNIQKPTLKSPMHLVLNLYCLIFDLLYIFIHYPIVTKMQLYCFDHRGIRTFPNAMV